MRDIYYHGFSLQKQLMIHNLFYLIRFPFLCIYSYPEEEQGLDIAQKLGISSLLPAKGLAWVWAQQKA